MEAKKRILVFASGTKTGGGSGFEFLVRACRDGRINGEVVGVISQHAQGGTRRIARRLHVPFRLFRGRRDYQNLLSEFQPDLTILWGWTQFAFGLNSRTTINVHPAPLPAFGGKGMYGLAVHAAVLEAFKRHELTHSEVCLHFVTREYDKGPVFFRQRVPLLASDTPTKLREKMKEHERAAIIFALPLLLAGNIFWDGRTHESLIRKRDRGQLHLLTR